MSIELRITEGPKAYVQEGVFTARGFEPTPRRFSAGESDVIFNMHYHEAVSFETVALWLQEITGKVTTAADVEREFDSRL